MSSQLPVEWLLRDDRWNAVVAWLLTATFVVAALDGLLALRLVKLAVAVLATVVAVVPALLARSWTRTVPWPLLLLASIPLAIGAVDLTFVDRVVVGLSVSALGMLLVVVLQMTTTLRTTPRFAIVFVVLSTLAFAGFWAVGSATSAALFGTPFVTTNDELMRVFTAAAIGGVTGGVAFRWYFRRQRRRTPTASPPEVKGG